MKTALSREASPFAIVALLVTHLGAHRDQAMQPFLDQAGALAAEHDPQTFLDEQVPVDNVTAGRQVWARQFVWVTGSRA